MVSPVPPGLVIDPLYTPEVVDGSPISPRRYYLVVD